MTADEPPSCYFCYGAKWIRVTHGLKWIGPDRISDWSNEPCPACSGKATTPAEKDRR